MASIRLAVLLAHLDARLLEVGVGVLGVRVLEDGGAALEHDSLELGVAFVQVDEDGGGGIAAQIRDLLATAEGVDAASGPAEPERREVDALAGSDGGNTHIPGGRHDLVDLVGGEGELFRDGHGQPPAEVRAMIGCRAAQCGRGSMAECDLPKVETRVRFPSPAPPEESAGLTRISALDCCASRSRAEWRAAPGAAEWGGGGDSCD